MIICYLTGGNTMNNIILKYLSVENFASFANKVEFTTQIDSGKKELVKKEFAMVREKPFFVRLFVKYIGC